MSISDKSSGAMVTDLTRAADRARPGPVNVTGKPILVADDLTASKRLLDLIPREWRPSLTQMIMRAVARKD